MNRLGTGRFKNRPQRQTCPGEKSGQAFWQNGAPGVNGRTLKYRENVNRELNHQIKAGATPRLLAFANYGVRRARPFLWRGWLANIKPEYQFVARSLQSASDNP